MLAAVFWDYGGPEVLRWEGVADHEYGADDVVIKVDACGVNHCDLDMRAGVSRWSLDFPMVLGGEFAGVVMEVGASVTGVRCGDPVTALQQYYDADGRLIQFGIDCWGGYAQYVRVPARTVIALDSAEQIPLAAAGQTAATTAWRMVTTLGEVLPGETVLIPSASGGVASLLVGVSKLRGARVIATVGSPEKVAAVRELGADVVGCYRDVPVKQLVDDATGGAGVDCVLDTVAGPLFQDHLAALRTDGRFVTCGAHAGEVVELDVVRLFQHGHRLIGFGFVTELEMRTALSHVLEGRLRVPIAARFPLPEAGAAHAALDRREHIGKLLLEVPAP
jgi:NADPH:quinone reductase-like Zn-dependent oxidoreductase